MCLNPSPVLSLWSTVYPRALQLDSAVKLVCTWVGQPTDHDDPARVCGKLPLWNVINIATNVFMKKNHFSTRPCHHCVACLAGSCSLWYMLLIVHLPGWAARYNTWLLIKLTPKGVPFSFLFLTDQSVKPNGDHWCGMHACTRHAYWQAHNADDITDMPSWASSRSLLIYKSCNVCVALSHSLSWIQAASSANMFQIYILKLQAALCLDDKHACNSHRCSTVLLPQFGMKEIANAELHNANSMSLQVLVVL